MASIGIVDYGLGNLRSVRGAVERLGHQAQVTADPAYACKAALNDRTGDMAGHDFVGGNTWVPGLIRDQYGSTIDNGTGFDDTIARNSYFQRPQD